MYMSIKNSDRNKIRTNNSWANYTKNLLNRIDNEKNSLYIK